MPATPLSTGLTITNPLILYRALIATRRIDPDPAQHRLALHLQKLYERLKDYEPIIQYSHRLNQISHALGSTPGQTPRQTGDNVISTSTTSSGMFGSMFQAKKERDSLALTKVLTSQEAALSLDSPKGLMLHGEVGTGKSMLIDLFADCLPNRKKKRWHFTTFMLETLAKLEQLRRSRQMIIPASLGNQDDYSLLWLAREMISTSPILFLDEFQLPDRAASKIITNLMTSFFHLGGVLIATSNRMPEELAKAAGVEFTPPPTRLESLSWRFGLGSSASAGRSEKMFSSRQGEFASFLELLKARCEVWEMEGGKDYRRRESEVQSILSSGNDTLVMDDSQGYNGLQDMVPGNIGLGYEQSTATKAEQVNEVEKEKKSVAMPQHYFIKPLSSDLPIITDAWLQAYKRDQLQALGLTEHPDGEIPWTPSSMRVYGRNVLIPRQHSGVTSWTFAELCASSLGPADYITLASTYHTVILSDVPVLTTLQKNEARRFITLLDALYEARCKLLITAAAGPDELFFPESQRSPTTTDDAQPTADQDAIYAETIAEVYQDATAPFRPNISMYGTSASAPSEPDYTHARLHGLFSADQLEDDPPNTRHRSRHGGAFARTYGSAFDRAYGVDVGDGREASGAPTVTARGPDFSQAGIFTGEDERFAYKRARSRLWEMCGARWWGRSEEGWWKPVEKAVRRWEVDAVGQAPVAESMSAAPGYGGVKGASTVRVDDAGEGIGATRGVDEKQDEVLFRHGASPFRTHMEPPPKFGWTHAWGMMQWGKKAGAWGKGVEGLEERAKERKKDGGDGG